MSSINDLLSVIMDSIRDTNMLYEYANKPGNETYCNWFMDRARIRLKGLIDDYEQVSSVIGLAQKVREGDPIAEALHNHITYQIAELKGKIL